MQSLFSPLSAHRRRIKDFQNKVCSSFARCSIGKGNLVFDNAIRYVVAEFATDGVEGTSDAEGTSDHITGTLDGAEVQHFHAEGMRDASP